MTLFAALLIILAVFALGDFIGAITKAKISSLFVIMMAFLILFLFKIIPSDIVEIAGLTTISKVGMQFLLINMGSSVELSQLKKEWRTVACSCIAMLIAVVSCLVLMPVIGKEAALVSAPILTGGIVATNVMIEAAQAKSLATAGALAAFIYATQKFVGTVPASAFGVKYANALVEDYRKKASKEVAATKESKQNKIFFHQKHAKYYTPFMCLGIAALLIYIAGILSKVTAGFIGQTLWSMILGIIARNIGLVPGNFLRDNAKSAGFFNFLALVTIVPSLGKIELSHIPVIGFNALAVFVVSVIFIFVLFKYTPLWKVVGSKDLSIGIAMCQMIGYPGTQMVADEIASAVGQNQQEKDLIQSKIGTAYVISGFASVTILSVFIANFLANFI